MSYYYWARDDLLLLGSRDRGTVFLRLFITGVNTWKECFKGEKIFWAHSLGDTQTGLAGPHLSCELRQDVVTAKNHKTEGTGGKGGRGEEGKGRGGEREGRGGVRCQLTKKAYFL